MTTTWRVRELREQIEALRATVVEQSHTIANLRAENEVLRSKNEVLRAKLDNQSAT